MSAIYLGEEKKKSFRFKKYIFYFLAIISFTLYVFFAAALVDLEVQQIVSRDLGLHAFPHDFIENNLQLQSAIKMTTFGFEKHIADISKEVPTKSFTYPSHVGLYFYA